MKKRILALVLAVIMVVPVLLTGCAPKEPTGPVGENPGIENPGVENPGTSVPEKITLGVMCYSTTDAEILAFKDYYVNYLADELNIEFIYSEALSTVEAELAFIENIAAAGAVGVLGTFTDLEAGVEKCEEYGIYYVVSAGVVADEEFAKVKDNPYFIGCTGPTSEAEKEAGREMSAYFAGRDSNKTFNYVIVSGGVNMGNEMHSARVQAMLEELQVQYGCTFEKSIEEMVFCSEPMRVESDKDVAVYIYPGYPMSDTWFSGLASVLMSGQYDVVMNVMSAVSSTAALVDEAEKATGKNLLVGTVDCFTEGNHAAFNTIDSTGDVSINYIAGKYGSIVGPALAACVNAVYGDSDVLRKDGGPFSIYMGYWIATSQEEYNELWAMVEDPAQIAFSADDLRSVIKYYNPDVTYEDFAELAGAYSVEAVKARRNG